MVNDKQFRDTEKLYHYTTLANALSIIQSGRLYMSALSKLNDINESYRPIWAFNDAYDDDTRYEWLDMAVEELRNYRQCSLTMDDERPGFAILPLWGHYANKGMGVCLVFDKNKIIESLSDRNDFHSDKVKYVPSYDNGITIDEEPKEYFRKHMSETFFRKSSDWEYEQEFRIICRTECTSAHIDISKAIMAAIMCYAEDCDFNKDSIYNSSAYLLLTKAAPSIPILIFAVTDGGPRLIKEDTQWFPEPQHDFILDV
ncbi:MAG: DUF2971 domain-containing protein [[Clostridium] fimetarium]|nr:DUF2971 domain-containing protein [Alistipes timonensis]MCM1405490.1 DUF2971 domain-containing protein [[Clostridium] fimetarium]